MKHDQKYQRKHDQNQGRTKDDVVEGNPGDKSGES